MPAYMVVQSTITDEAQFQKYRQAVVPFIAGFGGKLVARGAKVDVLEGEHDSRPVVLLAFRTRRNRRYPPADHPHRLLALAKRRSRDGEFGDAKLDPEATRLGSLSHASKNEEHPMAIRTGNPMSALAEPPKDRESEMREAVVDDADKTNGEDRDPVHGDGETLGLNGGNDLSQDD